MRKATDPYEKVIMAVTDVMKVSAEQLRTKGSNATTVLARTVACKILTERGFKQDSVAKVFGYKDRSTISNNLKSLNATLSVDKKLQFLYSQILTKLEALEEDQNEVLLHCLYDMRYALNKQQEALTKLIEYVKTGPAESRDTKSSS